MSNESEATGLATEPIKSAAKKRGSKKIGRAVTIGKSTGKKFKSGDLILFHVKHLHGQHGVIVDPLGNDQYLVRGNEEGIEGQLFQFSSDQLEPASAADLKEHNSTRLKWDYED